MSSGAEACIAGSAPLAHVRFFLSYTALSPKALVMLSCICVKMVRLGQEQHIFTQEHELIRAFRPSFKLVYHAFPKPLNAHVRSTSLALSDLPLVQYLPHLKPDFDQTNQQIRVYFVGYVSKLSKCISLWCAELLKFCEDLINPRILEFVGRLYRARRSGPRRHPPPSSHQMHD
jgi:hypothetical protein